MFDRESAAWAWAGLVLVVVAWVVAYDLWAHFSGHLTMSAQFGRWLFEEVAGPVIVAVWVGVFAGLTWHFLRTPR